VSFLNRIAACNVYDPAHFVPFTVDDRVVGQVHVGQLDRLAGERDLLEVSAAGVALPPSVVGFEQRSGLFDELADRLVASGDIKEKQRELYPVATRFGERPVCLLDRKLVPLFGIRAYGVHVNGFVRTPAGIEMWVGTRAFDKAVAPGKLDNLVAGGQPYGLGLMENVVKECAEEADIPEALARQARPAGALSYRMGLPYGLRNDVLFVYDLEVSPDFTPRNTDGELSRFDRWPIQTVAERVRDTEDFKFNVNLVIIDFLVRHGLIEPETPDYLDIAKGLRQ
jgi:hypothetical protein